MALAPISSTDSALGDVPATDNPGTTDLRYYVFALFFIFGGITSLNDVLIPKLKGLFSLSYFEVMLVQFAFFAAYFIISLPAAALVKRFGYMRTAAIGLLVMTAGCLLFAPASFSGAFPLFLGALFILASGITVVQVVANPLISMLGSAANASGRLTFAQAFNSLGTTIFPYVGARVILGSLSKIDEKTLGGDALTAFRATETSVIANAYMAIAAALAVVALLVYLGRHRLREAPASATSLTGGFDLLRRPRFAFGALSIFVYVGAEVSIGSLLVSYLEQPTTLALAAVEAGKLISFYWGGAMIGRFIGSGLLTLVNPARVLLGAAALAGALLIVSGASTGATAGYALIAVGFANSIQFPTIFSLANAGLGPRTADGSGVICMAIVGGAIVPLITGFAADQSTLRLALIVPFVCYAMIAGFALFCGRRGMAA